jgi:hypothetical protein
VEDPPPSLRSRRCAASLAISFLRFSHSASTSADSCGTSIWATASPLEFFVVITVARTGALSMPLRPHETSYTKKEIRRQSAQNANQKIKSFIETYMQIANCYKYEKRREGQ